MILKLCAVFMLLFATVTVCLAADKPVSDDNIYDKVRIALASDIDVKGGNLKVDVSDPRSPGQERRRSGGVGEFGQQAIKIQGERGHLEPAVCAWPLLSRSVAVDLDPVAVGIGEVERLADQVIGCAVQRPSGFGEPRERERQLASVGNEDR